MFTKCLRPLVQFWLAHGLRTVLYIDDGIIISQNAQTVLDNVKLIQATLDNAGFIVNEGKSHWELRQCGVRLGFEIDLIKGEVAIPKEKTCLLINVRVCPRASQPQTKGANQYYRKDHFYGVGFGSCYLIAY